MIDTSSSISVKAIISKLKILLCTKTSSHKIAMKYRRIMHHSLKHFSSFSINLTNADVFLILKIEYSSQSLILPSCCVSCQRLSVKNSISQSGTAFLSFSGIKTTANSRPANARLKNAVRKSPVAANRMLETREINGIHCQESVEL